MDSLREQYILESWLAAAELGAAEETLEMRARGAGARRVWIGRKDPVPEGSYRK